MFLIYSVTGHPPGPIIFKFTTDQKPHVPCCKITRSMTGCNIWLHFRLCAIILYLFNVPDLYRKSLCEMDSTLAGNRTHNSGDTILNPAAISLAEYIPCQHAIVTTNECPHYKRDDVNARDASGWTPIRTAVSKGNASRSCWLVHSAVGLLVTATWRMRRRPCSMMTKP